MIIEGCVVKKACVFIILVKEVYKDRVMGRFYLVRDFIYLRSK